MKEDTLQNLLETAQRTMSITVTAIERYTRELSENREIRETHTYVPYLPALLELLR